MYYREKNPYIGAHNNLSGTISVIIENRKIKTVQRSNANIGETIHQFEMHSSC